jgi:hypothetical protein
MIFLIYFLSADLWLLSNWWTKTSAILMRVMKDLVTKNFASVADAKKGKP